MNREGGNTKLSLDRAISVNNAMVQGTPLTGFKNHQGHPIFSYSAYAENRPLIKNDPTDGRNRRVDLRIVLTYRPAGADTPIEGVSRFVAKP
jgi:flagellar motor protein MotB